MWKNYFLKEQAKVKEILRVRLGRNPKPKDYNRTHLIRTLGGTNKLYYRGKLLCTFNIVIN